MNHLELTALADYWLGQPVDDAFEEHLLGCGECSAKLDWLARLAKGVAAVARGGDLAWVLTPEFLARLASEGLRVRTYAPPPGGGVQCTITSRDDLLMGRLRADLSQVPRLDVVFTGGEGELRTRLEDVPFRPDANGEIVLNQPVSSIRAVDRDVLHVRLISVEPAGERLVAEYTFHHSASPE